MPATKKLRRDELKAFDLAAAGHDGVLSDESGQLVIKPCTHREVAFYETASLHPEFAAWMPTFYGTLSLNDPNETAAEKESDAPRDKPVHDRHTSIVLQNLTAGFVKPCVLDVKLGAQLWDELAPLEKRKRLDAVSDATTSRALGMRVAGMRVWKGEEKDGYQVYDKFYGRTFTAENVIETLKEYLSAPIEDAERKVLAERFTKKAEEIKKVLEGQESRMYSASMLFVYEGDSDALKAALEEEKTRKPKTEEELDEEESGDEEEDIKKAEELKLIDFAHADWTPGLGADENVLQGVRSMERLWKELA
ncbi:SAICAR synthase-like protein [Ascodesmis nigricans]|uniref:Kinase n=1 Tax=Ascodesmis nigricans TaxID=341454 RepID=A0A4S2N2V4_9PEZI|nr:SAICAR synthase-like protein [Ascodesmis nigricans]